MAHLTTQDKKLVDGQGLAFEDVYNPQLCHGNSVGLAMCPDSTGSFGFTLHLSQVARGQEYDADLGITCHHVLAPGVNSCITTPHIVESPSVADHL